MRTYDIPYVKNVPARYPQLDYHTMNLPALKKHYLDTCMKCGGDVAVCEKCNPQCEFGKMAIRLKNGGSPDADIPLYNGKTMLQLAREDNAKRRAEMEAAKVQPEKKAKVTKRKNGAIVMEGWYDQAYASEDPIKWIMETFGLNERSAKGKVYSYQARHPGLKEEKPLWVRGAKDKEKKSKIEEPAAETQERATESVEQVEAEPEQEVSIVQQETSSAKQEPVPDDPLLAPLEQKINNLMNAQEAYKKQIKQLQEEYEAKIAPIQKLFDETKKKVDALYEALNILNE